MFMRILDVLLGRDEETSRSREEGVSSSSEAEAVVPGRVSPRVEGTSTRTRKRRSFQPVYEVAVEKRGKLSNYMKCGEEELSAIGRARELLAQDTESDRALVFFGGEMRTYVGCIPQGYRRKFIKGR
jgi:hypothetical protein